MFRSFLLLPWKTFWLGVAVVYSLSFLSGVVLHANGITPQTDQVPYPALALLAGAIGVALALRVMGTTQLSHLIALGIGFWFINLTNVVLNVQTFASGWKAGFHRHERDR